VRDQVSHPYKTTGKIIGRTNIMKYTINKSVFLEQLVVGKQVNIFALFGALTYITMVKIFRHRGVR
jgi:hypothetical protein